MSAVTQEDPWGVMPRLQDEINRLFGHARARPRTLTSISCGGALGAWNALTAQS